VLSSLSNVSAGEQNVEAPVTENKGYRRSAFDHVFVYILFSSGTGTNERELHARRRVWPLWDKNSSSFWTIFLQGLLDFLADDSQASTNLMTCNPRLYKVTKALEPEEQVFWQALLRRRDCDMLPGKSYLMSLFGRRLHMKYHHPDEALDSVGGVFVAEMLTGKLRVDVRLKTEGDFKIQIGLVDLETPYKLRERFTINHRSSKKRKCVSMMIDFRKGMLFYRFGAEEILNFLPQGRLRLALVFNKTDPTSGQVEVRAFS
jgi:hypothetical protein